jgi:hypothetical protein
LPITYLKARQNEGVQARNEKHRVLKGRFMRRKYQRATKGRGHGQKTEIAIYNAGETMLAFVQPAKFTSGEVH